jgi:hypothetical protein
MGNIIRDRWVLATTGVCRFKVALRLLICLLLAGATLLPYVQVRHYSFITFDDDLYVTKNPMVLDGLTWPGITQAFTTFRASNWHPLTWLSLMLDSQLYGVNPGAMHLTNVGFHIANTILLFLFLAGVTGALWRSALVAALFALHPLHVESVAWVAERKDVLSTFFWLAIMGAYAWYVYAPSVRRYLPVLLLFALGLMAKPMLITLPLVLLLLDYWPFGRIAGLAPQPEGSDGSPPMPGPDKRGYWQLIEEKIPLFVLAAASCLITVLAQEGSGSLMPLAIRPLDVRIANTLVAYVKYLVKMFWPYPMIFFYPLAPVPWWEAVWAGLALIALTVFVLYGARRHPYLAVGWLWFLGTLVPVIGLIQVGGQAMADRYTYVPLIGLFIVVAWGAYEITTNWRHKKILRSTGAAAMILACLLASWGQAGYWRNSEMLFTHAININPNNYMAYHHLGMDLANKGRLNLAIAMFKKTLAIAPAYPPAYNNLAIVYAREGKFAEAVPLFKKAIQLNPYDASFYRNLALAYRQEGKYSAAQAVMEQVKWLAGKK